MRKAAEELLLVRNNCTIAFEVYLEEEEGDRRK